MSKFSLSNVCDDNFSITIVNNETFKAEKFHKVRRISINCESFPY